jgi:type I restriction enzyme M protein
VIANPPFSLQRWGEEAWSADRFGRNFTGMPPRRSGDYAWVQHMVKSMAAKSGRLAVVLPQGALFRGGAEQRIRRHLLEADLVDAVIGLAPNLFYGTGLAACVMVLRQRKPAERKGRVLLIDAAAMFKRGRNQNTLEDEHRERIERLYAGFADEDGAAHVATLDEIASNDFDLNIGRYVAPPEAERPPRLSEAVNTLKAALDDAYAAEERLLELLRVEGLLDDAGEAAA